MRWWGRSGQRGREPHAPARQPAAPGRGLEPPSQEATWEQPTTVLRVRPEPSRASAQPAAARSASALVEVHDDSPAAGSGAADRLTVRLPWTRPGAARPAGQAGAAAPEVAAPGQHHTQVLDPSVASAAADPFRDTTALARHPVALDAPDEAPQPLLTRHRAAELGLYVGAALVLAAVVGIGARQWAGWTDEMRIATTLLGSAALVLGGLSLRLPWRRPMSEERTRAVSAALATGVAVASVGAALILGIGQSSDPVAGVGHAALTVLGLLGANLAARTPYAETLLLGSGCWLAWVGLAPGLPLQLGLLGLGAAWLAGGWHWAVGPRTAVLAGTATGLGAGASLAAAPGAWAARGVLAAIVLGGLWAFLRGQANYWLGLGAAAACALAAGIAADALSPAPALVLGGLATMAVSGVALRGARRDGSQGVPGADPVQPWG